MILRWLRPPYPFLSPVAMRRFNGASALFWLVMTPVALITGLTNVLTFVSVLSLWALFAASLSGYVASRVEVAQEQQDVPDEVVTALVEKTEISGEG